MNGKSVALGAVITIVGLLALLSIAAIISVIVSGPPEDEPAAAPVVLEETEPEPVEEEPQPEPEPEPQPEPEPAPEPEPEPESDITDSYEWQRGIAEMAWNEQTSEDQTIICIGWLADPENALSHFVDSPVSPEVLTEFFDEQCLPTT